MKSFPTKCHPMTKPKTRSRLLLRHGDFHIGTGLPTTKFPFWPRTKKSRSSPSLAPPRSRTRCINTTCLKGKPSGPWGLLQIKPILSYLLTEFRQVFLMCALGSYWQRGQWELPVATGRCPPTFGSNATAFQAGTVDNGQVAKNIRNHEWYSTTEDDPTLRESVYRLLTYDVPYEVFATTNMDPGDVEPLGYLNCEYIHNNVHNWVGGAAGQMGDVPVAAYDPIFFLHHWYVLVLHYRMRSTAHFG